MPRLQYWNPAFEVEMPAEPGDSSFWDGQREAHALRARGPGYVDLSPENLDRLTDPYEPAYFGREHLYLEGVPANTGPDTFGSLQTYVHPAFGLTSAAHGRNAAFADWSESNVQHHNPYAVAHYGATHAHAHRHRHSHPAAQPKYGTPLALRSRAPHVGASTPFAAHLAKGALPAHESGLDCRIRIFKSGTDVCGIARCDTSYGPVVLTAKADARVLQSILATAKIVRQDLLKQAVELPTESSSSLVVKAAALREKLAAKDPTALVKLSALKTRAATGDKAASAFLSMLLSADPKSGGPLFGAAQPPQYHRPGVMVGGRTGPMTTAQATRLRSVLSLAISHIPPARLTAAARS